MSIPLVDFVKQLYSQQQNNIKCQQTELNRTRVIFLARDSIYSQRSYIGVAIYRISDIATPI